jgi:hypothetical protein
MLVRQVHTTFSAPPPSTNVPTLAQELRVEVPQATGGFTFWTKYLTAESRLLAAGIVGDDGSELGRRWVRRPGQVGGKEARIVEK